MPTPLEGAKPKKSSAMPMFAILLFGATFVAGYKVGMTKAGPGGGSGYDDGFAAGVASIAKKFEGTGLLPEATPITMIGGTVVSIDGDSMVIDAPQVVRNPFDEPAPTARTVRIGATTKFVELVPKDPETLRKELDAMQTKKPGDVTTSDAVPSPFARKTLKITDIEVGARVWVLAADDILRASTFDAVEIQLAQRPTPQTGAPAAPDAEAIPEAVPSAGAPAAPDAAIPAAATAPQGAPVTPDKRP